MLGVSEIFLVWKRGGLETAVRFFNMAVAVWWELSSWVAYLALLFALYAAEKEEGLSTKTIFEYAFALKHLASSQWPFCQLFRTCLRPHCHFARLYSHYALDLARRYNLPQNLARNAVVGNIHQRTFFDWSIESWAQICSALGLPLPLQRCHAMRDK